MYISINTAPGAFRRMRNVIIPLLFFCITCLVTAFIPPVLYAAGDAFTQKDRELLIRLDERLNQIDKRFEQIDKRFEQIDKRFEFIQNMMMAMVGAFTSIVAVTIGFALWDRRSMTRPFEEKVKKIDADTAGNRLKIDKVIKAFRQLAREDERVAAILRSFSLL